MRWWVAESFPKTIANYDELAHGIDTSLQETTATLFGVKPISHWGVNSLGR